MLIDGNSSRGVEVNFSNKNTIFTLWFHSINFCFSGIGICKDNQSIANKEKEEKINIGGIDKLGTGRADIKETEDLDIIWTDIEKVNKLGKDGADIEEDPGIGGIDIEKNPSKSGEDTKKNPGIDRVDKPGIGEANVEEVKRQLARKQVTVQVSLFSFRKVFCFFFSFLKSETFGFLSCFSSFLSFITSI